MEPAEISTFSEDYCTCGHVASAHLDGDGACSDCRGTGSLWGAGRRCPRFVWSFDWQGRQRSA